MNFEMYVYKLPPDSEPSYITTDVAVDVYGFNKHKFSPKAFHLHNPSEHPYMAQRFDVEFHVNHYTPDAAARPGKNLEMFTHSVWLSLNGYDKDISLEEI